MGDKPKHDSLGIILISAATLLIFAFVFWLGFRDQITSGIRWARYGQIYIINLFTDAYKPLQLQLKSLPVETIQPIHLLQMTQAVNGFFKIPIGIAFMLMAVIALMHKTKHPFTRKFNLEGLTKEQASAFAVTQPITKFNPLEANFRMHGSPVPEKLPPFAEALTPDEWVTCYNIPVNDGTIDQDTARRAFAQQLGGRWKGVNDLPHFAQALFAAFAMKSAGKRTESDVFLGDIAQCWDPKFGLILTSPIKKKISKIIKDPKMGRVLEKVAAQHAFNVPALLRCLQVARENGGVLAPAQFLWLRAINRHYWYALNNLGRGSVHIEAAGSMCHFRAEKSSGKPIPNPILESAIEGLIFFLEDNQIKKFPAKDFTKKVA